jgi:hypothetical protein
VCDIAGSVVPALLFVALGSASRILACINKRYELFDPQQLGPTL